MTQAPRLARPYGGSRFRTGNTTVFNVSLDQRLEINTRFRASSFTQTRGPTTTTRIFFPSEMLIVNDRLKFYSIEDMAQVPQLLACLMFPVSVKNIICLLPMDMIFHIAYDDRRCKPNVDLTSTTIPCHVPLSSSSFPPGFSSIWRIDSDNTLGHSSFLLHYHPLSLM